jgi:hypothetical protein
VDPTQRQAAERQILAVVISLGIALVIHLAGLGSTLLNLAQEAMDPNGIFTVLDAHGLSDEEMGERIGRGVTFLACGAYSLLGLVWIPINAWAVYARKGWGRVSAMVYFVTTLPTCCCSLVGFYGLYALMRADVKQLFDEKR